MKDAYLPSMADGASLAATLSGDGLSAYRRIFQALRFEGVAVERQPAAIGPQAPAQRVHGEPPTRSARDLILSSANGVMPPTGTGRVSLESEADPPG